MANKLLPQDLDRLYDDAKTIYLATAKPKFVDAQQFLTLCHAKAFANLFKIDLDLKALEESPIPASSDD